MSTMTFSLLILASLSLAGPTLSVRVVDGSWLPIPGVPVEVVSVKNCVRRTASEAVRAVTDRQGAADVRIAGGGSYVVRSGGVSGFEAIERCVELTGLTGSEIAFVQMRLRPDLSQQVTLEHPADVAETRGPQPALGAFVGVYTDSQGGLYEIGVLADGEGLELSLPNGDSVAFPIRQKTRFSGPAGTVTFRVKGNRPTAFTFAPRARSATKR